METMDLLQLPAMAPWRLDQPGNGKMFGVLVVAASDGTVGYLRGFSGMVAGTWTIEGWAPPTYDGAARDAVWIPGEAELYDLGTDDDARTARSRELLPAIQETYRFTNAWGEVRALRDLFAPKEPPGGAGDCAAPKLLAQAYAQGLRPLALAEFWWGAPPRTGDRRAGSFYPACQGKCPPILAHMLRGVPAEPPPLFGAAAIAEREPAVVYEDEHLVVVNKPCGLLSVPGRSGLLRDSVSTRLRARYPDATGQLVVHRLDLDTSGLLLAAKDTTTFSALQRLFSRREIAKRYVAWLDGHVQDDEGVIDFPMRMDIDDRPRQIHDPVAGKAAVTTWQVLTRADGRTTVAFTPHTGRTHQLRVHASNPIGLDAPIVGDRLYGRVAPEYGERLLLHAESLAFTHPVTGVELRVTSPVPF